MRFLAVVLWVAPVLVGGMSQLASPRTASGSRWPLRAASAILLIVGTLAVGIWILTLVLAGLFAEVVSPAAAMLSYAAAGVLIVVPLSASPRRTLELVLSLFGRRSVHVRSVAFLEPVASATARILAGYYGLLIAGQIIAYATRA